MQPEVVTQAAPLVENVIPLSSVMILMLIPLTAYALWGDYFERSIQKRREEHESIEEMVELARVRLNGLFAVLAEAVIFLGSGASHTDTSAAAPHALSPGYAALRGLFGIGTIISLMLLQARYERKAKADVTPGAGREQFKAATKACGWSLLGGLVYLAVFGASMVVCTAPAALFKVSAAVGVGLLLLGVSSGVLAGLCASFAMAPFFVRKIFNAEKIADAGTVGDLDEIFDQSGVVRPDYWMLGLKQHHAANAMVAGFRSGKGFFKPGLFISKSAMDTLSVNELRAVVLHEISHISLGHLKKRFIFSAGLVICSSLFTGMCIEVLQAVSPHSPYLGFAGCVALLASFAFSTRFLAQQTRYQEIQADVHSIEKLGSSLEYLASGLRKLDRANGTLPFRKDPAALMIASGHPETELRVRILEKYFENTRSGAESPESQPEKSKEEAA